MPDFDNSTIKDEVKRVEGENITFSFYMSSAADGSAVDDQHVIDFDPGQWQMLDVVRPETEAMRQACVFGINERIGHNEFGASGLCEAIARNDAIIAHYLLSHVLSMQEVHFALTTECHAYSILQLYVDKNWNINTYLSRMQPPALSLAIKDIDLTSWFLAHGADPNATCGLDITPLSIAVRDAPFDIIRILFDHGGSIEHGQLLHFAARRGLPDCIDVLKYLLDKGAPVNSLMYESRADSYEQERLSGLGTPLHSAAAAGSLEIVDMLLSRGADPLIKNSRGELAVEEAEFHG